MIAIDAIPPITDAEVELPGAGQVHLNGNTSLAAAQDLGAKDIGACHLNGKNHTALTTGGGFIIIDTDHGGKGFGRAGQVDDNIADSMTIQAPVIFHVPQLHRFSGPGILLNHIQIGQNHQAD
ncbi:MAG: hypothetical protein BWY71_00819 [Planctomycetes bacterium ADurb.Bin412]|nr:MAG: hypothetical protein BWY71_00819 [Planctomycetes bacterium ADurb.Bin412]